MAEIVIIIIAVVAVFGAGKLPNIASWIGRKRTQSRRKAVPAGPSVIDITPPSTQGSTNKEPKPGTRHPGVEDAEIEER